MVKIPGVIASLFVLSGCVVADLDSSNYRYVPWVQVFQKPEASGKTNVAQRKADLYRCGVSREDNLDDPSWSLNTVHSGETVEQASDRNDKVRSCMKSKGYKVYGFDQCGPLKKPTGLCPN